MFLVDVIRKGEAPLNVSYTAFADPVGWQICLARLVVRILLYGRNL